MEMKRLVTGSLLFQLTVIHSLAYNQPARICRQMNRMLLRKRKVLWPPCWIKLQRHKWCTENVLIFLNFVCSSLRWIKWNVNVMYKIVPIHKPLNTITWVCPKKAIAWVCHKKKEKNKTQNQKKKKTNPQKAMSIFPYPHAFKWVSYCQPWDF